MNTHISGVPDVSDIIMTVCMLHIIKKSIENLDPQMHGGLLRLLCGKTEAVSSKQEDSQQENDFQASRVEEMHLRDFINAELVIYVWSDLLNETVVFASDNAVVSKNVLDVVYRTSELIKLIENPGQDLSVIHKAKRLLKGRII